MRKLVYLSVVYLFAALLLISCGKSAEHIKEEKEVAEAITKVHDELMKAPLDDMMKQLASAKAEVDTMASKMKAQKKAMPDSTLSADIAAASDKLKAAKESMNAWMSGHKPYDEKAKHEEAMQMLSTQKQELEKVKADIDAAHAAAQAVVERHKKLKEAPAADPKAGGAPKKL